VAYFLYWTTLLDVRMSSRVWENKKPRKWKYLHLMQTLWEKTKARCFTCRI